MKTKKFSVEHPPREDTSPSKGKKRSGTKTNKIELETVTRKRLKKNPESSAPNGVAKEVVEIEDDTEEDTEEDRRKNQSGKKSKNSRKKEYDDASDEFVTNSEDDFEEENPSPKKQRKKIQESQKKSPKTKAKRKQDVTKPKNVGKPEIITIDDELVQQLQSKSKKETKSSLQKETTSKEKSIKKEFNITQPTKSEITLPTEPEVTTPQTKAVEHVEKQRNNSEEEGDQAAQTLPISKGNFTYPRGLISTVVKLKIPDVVSQLPPKKVINYGIKQSVPVLLPGDGLRKNAKVPSLHKYLAKK